ncbi:MAG: hypothetical protein WA324_26465 [Bryobacteraceae bacterium]
MRIVLFIILGGPKLSRGEPSKGWSDWFSEGKALFPQGTIRLRRVLSGEHWVSRYILTSPIGRLVELHDALAGACVEAGQFAESEGGIGARWPW